MRGFGRTAQQHVVDASREFRFAVSNMRVARRFLRRGHCRTARIELMAAFRHLVAADTHLDSAPHHPRWVGQQVRGLRVALSRLGREFGSRCSASWL